MGMNETAIRRDPYEIGTDTLTIPFHQYGVIDTLPGHNGYRMRRLRQFLRNSEPDYGQRHPCRRDGAHR